MSPFLFKGGAGEDVIGNPGVKFYGVNHKLRALPGLEHVLENGSVGDPARAELPQAQHLDFLEERSTPGIEFFPDGYEPLPVHPQLAPGVGHIFLAGLKLQNPAPDLAPWPNGAGLTAGLPIRRPAFSFFRPGISIYQ